MSLTKSNIPYFDRNWSPVTGCSYGCPECYARAIANRFGKSFEPTFHPERLGDPAKRKKPTTIGVCFHGDLFDKEIRRGDFHSVVQAANAAPQHHYLFITKRADEMAFEVRLWHALVRPNHYFIVTVRNQQEMNAAEPYILAMAFDCNVVLSVEPMQGPVDLSPVADSLSGVILGGQSGPRAVPLDPDWVRAVRDQCAAADVPLMFKQASDSCPWSAGYRNGWPVLDGRTHTALAWPLQEKVI